MVGTILRICVNVAFWATVLAQSSTNGTDLTSLVNLFIGTETGANGGSGGNAFPGAAVPHAMVKVRVVTPLIRLYFLLLFLGWH